MACDETMRKAGRHGVRMSLIDARPTAWLVEFSDDDVKVQTILACPDAGPRAVKTVRS